MTKSKNRDVQQILEFNQISKFNWKNNKLNKSIFIIKLKWQIPRILTSNLGIPTNQLEVQ